MFYRKCGCCFKNYNNCPIMKYDKCDLEDECDNVKSYHYETDKCSCGFDEDYSGFPENPMYAQSYVPVQIMNKVFKPEVGLKRVHSDNQREVNRLDLEKMEFHQKVYEGYLQICDKYSSRIVKVDAHVSVDEVYKQVIERIREIL